MKVFHQLADVANEVKLSSVAIGNFDGVHLGHMALLQDMVRHARLRGASATVLTFYPHPVEVLRPGQPLLRLTTATEKLALLEAIGVEYVLVAKFDAELASLE